MSELERIVNDFVGSCIPDRHKKELVSALKSEFMKAVGENYSKEDTGKKSSLIDERKIWMKGYNQRGEEIRKKIKEM
jgi:hypothetical protein